jgi:MOSC domain-containing protein YiiM
MKVLSLNLSKAKAVQYRGKEVMTGIFKQPVDAPTIFVDKNNIVGDEQADLTVHGGEYKAVYAFSANHYQYWRDTLNQPDLSFGVFGENLTITDLDESTLCIGDQLSIGECILEISQPRVPCFKLSIALNNSKTPNLFTKSWSTGIYFCVVKPGHIAPDDEVKVIVKAENSVTVQALFRAYYDREFDQTAEVFEAALKVKALAPEWIAKVQKKMSQSL